MSYYLPASSLVTAVVLILGSLTYFANKRSTTNISFGLASFFVALWVAVLYLSDQWAIFSSLDVLVFNRLAIAFGILWAGTFMYTVISFPDGRLRRGVLTVSTLAVTLLLVPITVLTDKIVAGISAYSGGTNLIPGSLYFIYVLWTGILLVTFIIISVLKLRRAKSRIERTQFWYLVIGLIAFAVGAIVFNVVLPAITGTYAYARYGAYSVLVMVTSTSYAITKHKLFNVKVILAEITAVVLVLINAIQIFTAPTSWTRVFWVFVVCVVGLVGYFFVRSVEGEIKRREEVEKLSEEKTAALTELEQRNKNLATLQKISTIVLNETNMKLMTQHILDELPHQLDSSVGALLGIISDGHLVPYALSNTPVTAKIPAEITGDLTQYAYPPKKEFNLFHRALTERKVLDSDSLADFISPPVAKPVAGTIQRQIGAKHMEAIPLYAGGEALGVLLFVFSADRDQIHSKDLEIAKSIADEMSLALQRAKTLQKLTEANEYLTQLDKMKDEFISMASHELNTPLAAIEGYLSMILDEGMGKVDAKSKEYLSRAYSSSKRLAALILDLLNVSRIEQGRLKMKFAQSNMVELAESVVNELQIKADSKKIYLKVEGDKKKVPLTWCDPDRIREVIVNLTGNAIKFTQKGGITIKITADQNFIKTSVIDTGRGIAPEDQKKLFQKFSQIHREVDEHQGTGLGLYISKNFIELHHGKLNVESEVGKGATFAFEIPVLKEPPVEVKGAILETGESMSSPLSVGRTPVTTPMAKGPLNAPQIEIAKPAETPTVATKTAQKPS